MSYVDATTHPYITTITVTPVLSVHDNYVTGDFCGTTGHAMEFANAVRSSGGYGIVTGAVITDASAQIATGAELWLFNADVTAPTDSAAWALTDADMLKLQGVISFASGNMYAPSANNKVAAISNIRYPFKVASGATSLYVALVLKSTCTSLTASDIQVTLHIEQC